MSNVVYDKTKAIETILYLVNRVSTPSKYVLCKMIYLADKLSLERYGRLIFGESYAAMRNGATPSNAYNLINKNIKYPCEIKVDGNNVVALRDADLDYLSESDIECLNQVIGTYDKAGAKMRNDAHDSAWDAAWSSRGSLNSVPMPITSIVNALPNSEELLDYLTVCGVG
ncbi:MAG: Panacea domain-containing protein [Dehalococcoidia bacterium]|nr:Panacea domain-containing protein [Dehalococcoidia bacterium]